MERRGLGLVVFIAGILLMMIILVLGKYSIQPDLEFMGFQAYRDTMGGPSMLKLMVFVFGFPLAMALTLIGAAMFAPLPKARLTLFLLVAVTGAFATAAIPVAFGTQHSPLYFGVGGVSIALLVATTAWFWGHYRARLPERGKLVADLQAAGYFNFALAAWNLCGVAGMPGFAIFPDKMLAFDALPFVVGQLKAVMAFFVMGWLFSALSFWRATR